MSYEDDFDYNLLKQLNINEYFDTFIDISRLNNDAVQTPKKGLYYEHDNRLGFEQECLNDCSE
jgi:hypothetical protein